MTAADKATRMAESISEGLNCLVVFLCAPALRKFRSEAPGLLRRWEADYAPTFRHAVSGVRPGNRAKLEAALKKISRAATTDLDLDAPEQMAALRLAIREAILGFEFPLPELSPADFAICELHGSACPLRETAAR
jgi:hypothetical protein